MMGFGFDELFPEKKVCSLQLDVDIVDFLEAEAFVRGVTKSELVNRVLRKIQVEQSARGSADGGEGMKEGADCGAGCESSVGLYDYFGRFIKQYRKRKGLKQKEVAERLGIKQSSFSLIENGNRRATTALMHEILRVLGTDMTEFESFRRKQKDIS